MTAAFVDTAAAQGQFRGPTRKKEKLRGRATESETRTADTLDILARAPEKMVDAPTAFVIITVTRAPDKLTLARNVLDPHETKTEIGVRLCVGVAKSATKNIQEFNIYS